MLRATDSDGACHHYGREPLREFVPPRPLPLEASSSSSSSCVCPTADGGGSSGSSGGGSSSSSIVIGGGSSAVADGFRRPGGEYPRHSAFEHPRGALQRLRARDGASAARNTSDFPLLLCIGQGKTATKSLNKAFVMLGLQTAHFYGAGVYGLLFDNAAEKAGHPFLFNVNEAKHVDAVLDTPVVDFYNEILLAYPNARVILTVRAVKSWLKSQQKFYCCFARGCHRWLAPWRRGSNLVYGTECPTKEQAVKRYVQHNRNVYDNVPHDRLLVMDIPGGDGWEKLVPFLNSFMPRRIPMPPSNFTFPRGIDESAWAARSWVPVTARPKNRRERRESDTQTSDAARPRNRLPLPHTPRQPEKRWATPARPYRKRSMRCCPTRRGR